MASGVISVRRKPSSEDLWCFRRRCRGPDSAAQGWEQDRIRHRPVEGGEASGGSIEIFKCSADSRYEWNSYTCLKRCHIWFFMFPFLEQYFFPTATFMIFLCCVCSNGLFSSFYSTVVNWRLLYCFIGRPVAIDWLVPKDTFEKAARESGLNFELFWGSKMLIFLCCLKMCTHWKKKNICALKRNLRCHLVPLWIPKVIFNPLDAGRRLTDFSQTSYAAGSRLTYKTVNQRSGS